MNYCARFILTNEIEINKQRMFFLNSDTIKIKSWFPSIKNILYSLNKNLTDKNSEHKLFSKEKEVSNFNKLLLSKLCSLNNIPLDLNIDLIYTKCGNNLYMFRKTVTSQNEDVLPGEYGIANVNTAKLEKKLGKHDCAENYYGFETILSQLFIYATKIAHNPLDPREIIPDFICKSGRIIHDITITSFQKQSNKIIVESKSDVKFYRFPWGEFSNYLATPPFPKLNKTPEVGLVLGCSEGDGEKEINKSVKNGLEQLNEVLQQRKKLVVFIQGEPGSGKEVYAKATHFGINSIPDRYMSRSVGGMQLDDTQKILFGEAGDKGVVVPGVIEKAEGGTLFLDETDKIAGGKVYDFYSMLLRPIENKVYLPVNGRQIKEIQDINWIFAGAFEEYQKENKKGNKKNKPSPPYDFWTRVTNFIRIESPTRDPYYCKQLFIHFFFIYTTAKLKDDVSSLLDNSGELFDFRVQIARSLLFDKPEVESDKLGSSDFLKSLSEFVQKTFNCIIVNKKMHYPSVRVIIQITKLVHNKVWAKITTESSLTWRFFDSKDKKDILCSIVRFLFNIYDINKNKKRKIFKKIKTDFNELAWDEKDENDFSFIWN